MTQPTVKAALDHLDRHRADFQRAPEGRPEKWLSAPFEPTERNGRLHLLTPHRVAAAWQR